MGWAGGAGGWADQSTYFAVRLPQWRRGSSSTRLPPIACVTSRFFSTELLHRLPRPVPSLRLGDLGRFAGNRRAREKGVRGMEEIVAGIVCLLLVFALVPLLWWRRRQVSQSSHREEDEAALVGTSDTPWWNSPDASEASCCELIRSKLICSRQAGFKQLFCVTVAQLLVNSSPSEDAVESDEEGPGANYYTAKASTKKERKKQEREAQRQAEEAARESRKTKEDYYSEMRRKKDEEREAQERLMEEEALARKAKEEESAALEFEKWKGEFSVDAEGTTENEIQNGGQDLLSDFVEYIKKQKCVPLEDLAAEFKLRTQECINRITSLESMARLSGVMDDRGKYIYISPEEMKAVADFIKREGRVSISHLASKSNQFIDLEPKPQFIEEISNADGIAHYPTMEDPPSSVHANSTRPAGHNLI
ncbi:hypothetical protein Taro_028174 [Colocasia esculenta]|uniref:DDRGK domain-containing protein 1 n=1 Tax=Colocasia esculenta TaxID=4460 RepID=A0A843VGK8_COLES|nr:hypothetical protein [Colocasia esculenta]